MSEFPKVSIIFPTRNSTDLVLKCIESITKLTYPKSNIEIILIDNGSSDNSVIRVKGKFPFIKIISNSKNESFAKSINQGIEIATGDFYFVTNDDVIFGKKSIAQLISHLIKNPDIGIIGGKIYSLVSPEKVISTGCYFNSWTGDVSVSIRTAVQSEPDWIQGCALLVRKAVMQQIGSLDEQFNYFFEDFDLCVKARRVGWRVVCLPIATFWHGNSTTANRNLRLKYAYWYQSKIRFILKHLRITKVISILLFQSFSVIPYRTLILRDGRFIPYIKGLLWNLSCLTETLKLRKSMQTFGNVNL